LGLGEKRLTGREYKGDFLLLLDFNEREMERWLCQVGPLHCSDYLIRKNLWYKKI
jgi:hypothetical protein